MHIQVVEWANRSYDKKGSPSNYADKDHKVAYSTPELGFKVKIAIKLWA